MTTVAIEYCVPCGHLDRAQSLAGKLLSEFGQEVESVSLVTGDNGVFTVSVDGEMVYDKAEEGFDADVIVDRVADRVPTRSEA